MSPSFGSTVRHAGADRPVMTSRRQAVLGLGALALVGGGIAVAALAPEPSPVGAALLVARDQERFDSSAEAAEGFAEVASGLLDDGRECVDRLGSRHPACEARLAGVAFAQVMAVAALDCTQPAIFDARIALVDYLEATARMGENPTAIPPPVHPIPTCG